MSKINQLITLGIGTPGGIKEFMTFGLQIPVPVGSLVVLSGETMSTVVLSREITDVILSAENNTVIL